MRLLAAFCPGLFVSQYREGVIVGRVYWIAAGRGGNENEDEDGCL